ncbi:hypothetical protein [Pantoea sp. SORGH_AS_0659]|uniref:hypothetical protein n=1 Tax=Pantoea sp. SORGH_AS_0659 TaxID=3062597 RepID=UPI00286B0415|nr:hypothetical protein [Pantoea sp. SORGH_AS_0659]
MCLLTTRLERNGKVFQVPVQLAMLLEGWLREKLKTLSRHSETAKAFSYGLNHWAAPDNNIAEMRYGESWAN